MSSGDAKRARARDAVLAAGLALAAFAAFATGWHEGLYGGVAEVGAKRVLAGDLPYRDFWTIYAPGQFYLLAGLFRLLGPFWWVSVAAASVLAAAGVAAVYAAGRCAGAGRGPALAAGLVVAAAVAATPFARSCGSYPPALPLVVGAWALAIRGGRRALLGAGACLGLAALFKHDVAGYAAVGIAVFGTLRRQAEGAPLRDGLRAPLPVAGGALAMFAPPMALLAVHAGPDLVQDLVRFPLGDFSASRPERFPLWPASLAKPDVPIVLRAVDVGNSLGFWLPWLAWLPVAWAAARRPARCPLALGLFASFLLHMLAARVQINTHAISWTVYPALALAALWRREAPLPWRGAGLALAVALLASHAVGPAVRGLTDPRPRIAHPLPAAGGLRVPEPHTAHLAQLAGWVERTVPPDARIFAGAARHDSLLNSPIRLYFLLERQPAVRYQELHPAVADTALVQREMIADLQASQAPLVVLRSTVSDAHLDAWLAQLRQHVPEAGATLLDAYLACAYEEKERLGPFRVRVRRAGDRSGCVPASPAR